MGERLIATCSHVVVIVGMGERHSYWQSCSCNSGHGGETYSYWQSCSCNTCIATGSHSAVKIDLSED